MEYGTERLWGFLEELNHLLWGLAEDLQIDSSPRIIVDYPEATSLIGNEA